MKNLDYIALTIHFRDGDWLLLKKIVNFCLTPNHKGETMIEHVETCLNECYVKKLLTRIVDDVSFNDKIIAYLKIKVHNWKGLVLDGEMLLMGCYVRILTLVVSEGLKDPYASISLGRSAMRYVRSLPSRLAKFY